MRGSVKFYNAEKGYGFIYGEDENDYHFSINAYKSAEEPARGVAVDFEPAEGKKGKFAKTVRPDAASQAAAQAAAAQAQAADRGKSDRRDDRIECPHCKRKMVPRLFFEDGEPTKTYCSFCGELVEKLPAYYRQIYTFFIVLGIIAVIVFFAATK